MRNLLVFVALLICTYTLRAQVVPDDDLGSTHFKERRSKVIAELPPGAVAVLFSGGLHASGLSSPVPDPFQAAPDFYYLTGLNLPHSVLVLFPKAIDLKEGRASQVLFLPDTKQLPLNTMGFGYKGDFGQRNEDLIVRPISQWRKFCLEILDADQTDRIWTQASSPADFYVFRESYQFQPPLVEFHNILSPNFQADPEVSQLYNVILRADSSKLEASQREVKSWLNYFGKQPDPILKQFLAVRGASELATVKRRIEDIKIDYLALNEKMTEQRIRKSAKEMETMREAARLGVDAMKAGAKEIRKGAVEGMVEGRMYQTVLARGARPARSIQVVSESPASNYLYAQNSGVLDAGGAVTVDLALRLEGYCSHLSRTFPLGAAFDPEYARLYAAAEEIHRATLAGCKSGLGPNAHCKGQKDALFAKLDAVVLVNGSRRTWRDEYGSVSLYPIGLDLFESLNPTKMEVGMTFEVETLVSVPPSRKYKKEFWGKSVRLRDVIVISTSGAEILTRDMPFRMVEVEAMTGWEK